MSEKEAIDGDLPIDKLDADNERDFSPLAVDELKSGEPFGYLSPPYRLRMQWHLKRILGGLDKETLKPDYLCQDTLPGQAMTDYRRQLDSVGGLPDTFYQQRAKTGILADYANRVIVANAMHVYYLQTPPEGYRFPRERQLALLRQALAYTQTYTEYVRAYILTYWRGKQLSEVQTIAMYILLLSHPHCARLDAIAEQLRNMKDSVMDDDGFKMIRSLTDEARIIIEAR